MRKLLGISKSSIFIISLVYLVLIVVTSFFLWLPNRGLSRFINQIPIIYFLIVLRQIIRHPLTISDKISLAILLGSPISQFLAHLLFISNQQELVVVFDMFFILTVHSLLIVLFRYEGGVAITAQKKDLTVTFPILIVLMLVFGLILMNYIPNQYVFVFVLFIGIVLVLTATFLNRRVSNSSKILSNIGFAGILSCDFIALYSKFVYKFPYSFELYRASYFVGIYLIVIGSLINTEYNLIKKSKSKHLQIKP